MFEPAPELFVELVIGLVGIALALAGLWGLIATVF
jgi:hypothetical protein